MNPDTNKFEKLLLDNPTTQSLEDTFARLLRPDGTPVPKHWTILSKGENVVVKNYTFKVAHIGESYLVLEPMGPIKIGEKK